MTADLAALCFEARDPARLARFWSGLLDWEPIEDEGGRVALEDPDDEAGFRIRFLPGEHPRQGPNQLHFDLTSASAQAQEKTVARVLELGGAHLDIGQGPEVTHVVLADPEGNEMCVIAPGNRFLAGCPFIGALSCDGSQAQGYFWSRVLDWPLVWDQDQETAVRSPLGGPKISWGGPPLNEKRGPDRVHFDLVPADGFTQRAEVQRLIGLGARPGDPALGHGDAGQIVLLDPDGHEFCVGRGMA